MLLIRSHHLHLKEIKSHSAASEMPSADISNKKMETQSCFSCWLEKIRQIENAFTLSWCHRFLGIREWTNWINCGWQKVTYSISQKLKLLYILSSNDNKNTHGSYHPLLWASTQVNLKFFHVFIISQNKTLSPVELPLAPLYRAAGFWRAF